jgi:hypothetical protein
MEQPEPNIGRSRRPHSPVYYVQVRRGSHPISEWVAVDVAEDKREAARIAAIAVRALTEPAPVRVIGSAELLRDGGQDAINRAAVDLWQTAGRQDERPR